MNANRLQKYLVAFMALAFAAAFTLRSLNYVVVHAAQLDPSSTTPSTETTVGFEFAGQFGGRMPNGALSGTIAYLAQGTKFMVLDVSNPLAPQIINNQVLLHESINSIIHQGNYVYLVGDLGGFFIIDVTLPTAPRLVGQTDLDTRLNDIALAGNYAYVTSYEGFFVVDVSEPANPVEVKKTDLNGESIAVFGNYAYLNEFTFFYVIDLSTPDDPQVFPHFRLPDPGMDVIISGGYAFVPTASISYDDAGLQVIDLSDPTSLQIVGSTTFSHPGDSGMSISLAGNTAQVVIGEYGIAVVDISNFTAPSQTGFQPLPDVYDDLNLLVGSSLIVFTAPGLATLDLSNPNAPTLSTFTPVPCYANGIKINASLAYLTCFLGGLQVVDITDLDHPDVLSYYDVSEWAFMGDNDPARALIFVRDYADGVRIIDVSDPTYPVSIGLYDDLPYAMQVENVGNELYVTFGADLHRVDISSPGNPMQIATYDAGDSIRDITSGDGYLYWTSAGSVQVIDLNSPAPFPDIIASEPVVGAEELLYHQGVLIAEGSSYVIAFDVSDPYNPHKIGQMPVLNGDINAMGKLGNDIAVAQERGNSNGDLLQAYNLSIPNSPIEIDTYELQRGTYDLVWDERLYVLGVASGVTVLNYTPPASINPDVWVSSPLVSGGEPGGQVSIPVHFGNLGFTPAYTATLSLDLPAGITYQNDDSGITPDISGSTYTWSLGDLLPSGKDGFNLLLSLPVDAYGTSFPLTFTLTHTGTDADPSNDTKQVEAWIARQVFLPLTIQSAQ